MSKRIWIITLFPEYFIPLKECGVVGAALRGERGPAIDLNVLQLRHFSPKDYKGVDDAPYGGGVGMVMRADVLKNALVEGIAKPLGLGENFKEKMHVVYTTPRGTSWSTKQAQLFAANYLGADFDKELVFICGRYEGIDERFLEKYVDQEISIGDYVLSGGELAVNVIIDSAMRFAPGVLGNAQSFVEESFNSENLLEHPHYTRPQNFEGTDVPAVLLSGNPKFINEYQAKERIRLTQLRRPDLLKKEK